MNDSEIIVEIPVDLVEQIEAIIAETGESFSEFVNRVVGTAPEELDERT